MLWWTLVLCLLAQGAAGQGNWSSNAVYYRTLVDSFKDADGDGLGDLAGVAKQLSYIGALGADAVILSPILARSKDCAMPGTLDFTAVDPRYGSLNNFVDLLEKAKKMEMKVVITLPVQTVSVASELFVASANKTNGFEDSILWKGGNADDVPATEPGVESWIWHAGRSSFWASSSNEAVLNMCSEGLASSLSAAQCAWLRRGVSGVLLAPDYPMNNDCAVRLVKKMSAEALSCVRSANFEATSILVESRLPPEEAAKYYGSASAGASSVLCGPLTGAERASAPELALAYLSALLYAPNGLLPSWTTSVPDEHRIATRYGSEMIDAVNLLTLMLPGAAVIQQGDELGAADAILEWASTPETCWPSRPVASAAPFAWDDKPNGGFSSGESWLPLAPNYRYANAKTQFPNDLSHVGVMRMAAALRKSPAMGPHAEITRLGDAVAILRWGGPGSLLLISNIAKDQTEVQLSKIPGLAAEMSVAASSAGSNMAAGSHITLEKTLKLAPGETILLVGAARHCGGPGPVDKITNKLTEGWQKLNKYFNS